jgi:transcriptional regulator
MKKLTKKEQDLANNNIKIAYNQNMYYEDDDNNITIEVNEVTSCFIDYKLIYCLHIEADNKDIFINFDAKELLTCLNKRVINELKENLKEQIDNL